MQAGEACGCLSIGTAVGPLALFGAPGSFWSLSLSPSPSLHAPHAIVWCPRITRPGPTKDVRPKVTLRPQAAGRPTALHTLGRRTPFDPRPQVDPRPATRVAEGYPSAPGRRSTYGPIHAWPKVTRRPYDSPPLPFAPRPQVTLRPDLGRERPAVGHPTAPGWAATPGRRSQ